MRISFAKDELNDGINIALSIVSIQYRDMKRFCKTERRYVTRELSDDDFRLSTKCESVLQPGQRRVAPLVVQ